MLLRALCLLLLLVAGNCNFFWDPFPSFPKDPGFDFHIGATPSDDDPPKPKQDKPNFKGRWELFTENSGVSAMHLILLPKINKVLMFDSTIWLKSNIMLPKGEPCRMVDEGKGVVHDCHAHSVLLDIETKELVPLRVCAVMIILIFFSLNLISQLKMMYSIILT